MRAGESATDQLTTVWSARVDGNLIRFLHDLDDAVDVAEIDSRMDSLRVQIQGQSD